MTRRKRIRRPGIAVLVMAVHLSIAVWHNLGGFLQSIAIVRGDQKDTKLHAFISNIQQIGRPFPLATYGQHTGIATGYGFFAPNVASPFVLQAIVRQPGSHRCDTITAPPRLTGTTAVRYRAFTTGMRRLLPETWQHYGVDPLAERYTRVLARQTAQHWADCLGAELVSFSVYAVRLPTLRRPGTQYVDIYTSS